MSIQTLEQSWSGPRRRPDSRNEGSDPVRARIDNREPAAGGVVKSAGRALEILELFDDIQRNACVAEISEVLGYPQSSTSVLLRSLATCGYLLYDGNTRTYAPTSRVALLGHWAGDGMVCNGPILAMMQQLSERSGETIILATRSGLSAKYIKVIQAQSARRAHVALGCSRPLSSCSSGFALLGQLPESETVRIVTRVRAEAADASHMASVREVLDILRRGRDAGYFYSPDLVLSGAAMIAIPVPFSRGQPPLSMGIGGLSWSIAARKNELIRMVSEASAQYLGVDLIPAQAA